MFEIFSIIQFSQRDNVRKTGDFISARSNNSYQNDGFKEVDICANTWYDELYVIPWCLVDIRQNFYRDKLKENSTFLMSTTRQTLDDFSDKFRMHHRCELAIVFPPNSSFLIYFKFLRDTQFAENSCYWRTDIMPFFPLHICSFFLLFFFFVWVCKCLSFDWFQLQLNIHAIDIHVLNDPA